MGHGLFIAGRGGTVRRVLGRKDKTESPRTGGTGERCEAGQAGGDGGSRYEAGYGNAAASGFNFEYGREAGGGCSCDPDADEPGGHRSAAGRRCCRNQCRDRKSAARAGRCESV